MGRAYAELLEREGKITQTQQELKPLAEARELIKKGQRLKALELLGTSLEEVQLEYLDQSGRAKTPEEIARSAAAAEYERREQARKEADEASQRAQQEASQRQTTEFVTQHLVALDELAVGMTGQLDQMAAQRRTTGEALQWWVTSKNQWPAPEARAQVLHDYEAFLQSEQAARGFRKAAPPAAAGTQPIGDKGTPAARGTTSAITPADSAEVPLRPVRNGQGMTALERAKLVAAELGYRD